MSWRGLSSRLAKIEAKQRPRFFRWPIIFALYPEKQGGEIVCLKAGDETFERHDGENDLAAFALRVQDDAGGPLPINAPRIMLACYGPLEPPQAMPAPIDTRGTNRAYRPLSACWYREG